METPDEPTETRPSDEAPPIAPPVMASVPAPPTTEPSTAMRMVAPINVSGWAITSGYLGLFSVLLVFAPFALLTGILALRDIARNPGKLGKGRAWFGIVMGVLGSIGLALIAKSLVTQ